MSSCKKPRNQESRKSRFSKRNNKKQTVQEYIFNIKSVYQIEGGNEKDFLNYLDIIDNILKTEKIKFNYNKEHSIQSFLENLFLIINGNNSFYSKTGTPNYNPKKKEIKVIDPKMSRINRNLNYLFLKPFYDLKGKINKSIWNSVAYYYHKDYMRCRYSEFYDYFIETSLINLDEQIEESKDDKSSKEYYLECLENQKNIVSFLEIMDEFSKIKLPKSISKKANKNELTLLKIIKSIVFFNYEIAIPFIELNDKDEEWFERFEDTESSLNDIFYKANICNSLYSGQYILTYEEGDYLNDEYLEWINQSSNNGFWPMHMFNEIIYTKSKQTMGHKKERNKMYKHYENYEKFNRLIKKIEDEL